jgi:hypothetical protein
MVKPLSETNLSQVSGAYTDVRIIVELQQVFSAAAYTGSDTPP